MNAIANNQRYLKALSAMQMAFLAVPKPEHLSSCDCCHPDSEKQNLLSTPLNQLSGVLLEDFIFSAFNTIGTEEDFKYFLPRVLELIAQDEFGDFCDLGLVGDKLAQANYKTWPENLADSVDRMLRSIWRDVFLKQEVDETKDLDGYLCLVGNAGVDIKLYLDDLFKAPKIAAKIWEWEIENARKGKLFDCFWRHEANQKIVVDWIVSKEVEDLVMPIYLESLKSQYEGQY